MSERGERYVRTMYYVVQKNNPVYNFEINQECTRRILSLNWKLYIIIYLYEVATSEHESHHSY